MSTHHKQIERTTSRCSLTSETPLDENLEPEYSDESIEFSPRPRAHTVDQFAKKIEPDYEKIDKIGNASLSRHARQLSATLNAQNSSGTGFLSIKEQERRFDQVTKENFNLKLKIYYMEEQMHELSDDRNDEIREENVAYRINFDFIKHENDQLKKALSSSSDYIKKLNAERDPTNCKLPHGMTKQQETEFSTLKEEADKCRAQFKQLQERFKKQEDTINELKSIVTLYQTERANAPSFDGLNKERELNYKRIEELNAQLTIATEKANEYEDAFYNCAEMNAKLQSDNKILDEENEDLLAKLEYASQSYNLLAEESELLVAENAEINSHKDRIANEYYDLEICYEMLLKDLDKTRKQVTDLSCNPPNGQSNYEDNNSDPTYSSQVSKSSSDPTVSPPLCPVNKQDNLLSPLDEHVDFYKASYLKPCENCGAVNTPDSSLVDVSSNKTNVSISGPSKAFPSTVKNMSSPNDFLSSPNSLISQTLTLFEKIDPNSFKTFSSQIDSIKSKLYLLEVFIVELVEKLKGSLFLENEERRKFLILEQCDLLKDLALKCQFPDAYKAIDLKEKVETIEACLNQLRADSAAAWDLNEPPQTDKDLVESIAKRNQLLSIVFSEICTQFPEPAVKPCSPDDDFEQFEFSLKRKVQNLGKSATLKFRKSLQAFMNESLVENKRVLQELEAKDKRIDAALKHQKTLMDSYQSLKSKFLLMKQVLKDANKTRYGSSSSARVPASDNVLETAKILKSVNSAFKNDMEVLYSKYSTEKAANKVLKQKLNLASLEVSQLRETITKLLGPLYPKSNIKQKF